MNRPRVFAGNDGVYMVLYEQHCRNFEVHCFNARVYLSVGSLRMQLTVEQATALRDLLDGGITDAQAEALALPGGAV